MIIRTYLLPVGKCASPKRKLCTKLCSYEITCKFLLPSITYRIGEEEDEEKEKGKSESFGMSGKNSLTIKFSTPLYSCGDKTFQTHTHEMHSNATLCAA